jgi:dTDP-glucose 4,6-dehydratase
MTNKKVLITGSCGFVFGNFLRKAVYEKQPYQLVSVDRVSEKAINSMYWNKNHIFHVADIRDQHVMNTIFQFEQPDIVIHGASEGIADNLLNPNSFITSNVLGTQVIINCCIKHNVERLIYASTDQVYGQLLSESDPSWKESSEINPRNPYSASKAAGELLVKAANQTYGLIYNIARSSNNYGPRQAPENLVPKTIKSILHGEKIPIYGQGLQMREWTHVFDNCAALMTIINKGAPNETYNIGSNQELTNVEVVQKICNIMGKGHDLMSFVPDPRLGHDFRYSVDSNKIRDLGWKPNFKFKEGITNTVEWYMSNQWFLK